MSDSNDWMLFQYGLPSSEETISIGRRNFQNALEKSVTYAFISLPFTNANISIGSESYGLNLERRVENIVKGLLAENLIIDKLSRDSNLVQNNYLAEYPEQTPYWEKDICDSVKKSKTDDNIISQVDIKGIHIKWDLQNYPTVDDLNQTELKRTKRCPDQHTVIRRPLAMLLEEPWRNFNKLKTQYKTHRMKERVNFPHECLFFLSPRFEFEELRNNEVLLSLYEEYYNVFYQTPHKEQDYIELNEEIPSNLEFFTSNAVRFPKSIKWLLENWEVIDSCLKRIIEELIVTLEGYWIWIFGFVDQQSTNSFKKVYQNDSIFLNDKKLWSSATRSPHEKKWTKFTKGKRKSRPLIDENHPDLYWNNNTIDISSPFVYSIQDHL